MTRLERRTRRARTAAASALLVCVLALGACAAPLPEPTPDAVPAVPPPATSVAQSTDVLADLGAVLEAADAALDPALLRPRVFGPALAIRRAEYVRAEATDGDRPPTALPTAAQTLIVPMTDEWPRTQMVVTEQPDDLQAPRILVLTQAEPRENYRLWGWARLGQGVQMPATAEPTTGSAPVAPDAEGLVVTPVQALEQYADLLARGADSEYVDTFTEDFFRTGIEEARAQYSENVEAVGSIDETYTAVPTSVVALATADGGAIVVGRLETVTTLTLTEGSLTLDATDRALSGESSVTDHLTYTWADVLAFYVPPAGSDAQVQVLAGEHARTEVSGE